MEMNNEMIIRRGSDVDSAVLLQVIQHPTENRQYPGTTNKKPRTIDRMIE